MEFQAWADPQKQKEEAMRSWGKGEYGCYCLSGTEFLFGVMEKSRDSDDCTTVDVINAMELYILKKVEKGFLKKAKIKSELNI